MENGDTIKPPSESDESGTLAAGEAAETLAQTPTDPKAETAVAAAENIDLEDAADKAVEVTEAELTWPEGGYGWVAVMCMFFVQFFVVGIANSVGIFTGYFVGNATFPGAQNTLLAMAATLTSAGMNLYGPFTGMAAERFGYRIVACTGALFLLAGGVVNSYAVEVWTLFVAAIIGGFGYSCLIAPAVAIPSHYFRRRLGLAIGLGMSGVGIGGVVITPVSQALLDAVGWRWAMRYISIVSGVCLFVVGLLMKMRLPRRQKGSSVPLIDKSMFKNLTYWRLAAMCFLTPGQYLGPFLFIPQQMQDLGALAGGISAALCLALMNASTAVGQITTGIILNRLGKYNVGVITAILTTVAFFPVYILSVNHSGAGMIIFSIMAGMFGGPFPVVISNLAADRFGQANFAAIIGMVFFWFAPGILITGPILGSIADANSQFSVDGARLSTNWLPVIAYGGACQAIVAAIAIWLRVEKAGWKLAFV